MLVVRGGAIADPSKSTVDLVLDGRRGTCTDAGGTSWPRCFSRLHASINNARDAMTPLALLRFLMRFGRLLAQQLRVPIDTLVCSATAQPDGRFRLEFELQTRDGWRATLTIEIPSLRELCEADGIVSKLRVVSSDGDESYYARVNSDEEYAWAQLRVDHAVRHAFWMEADLAPIYFAAA